MALNLNKKSWTTIKRKYWLIASNNGQTLRLGRPILSISALHEPPSRANKIAQKTEE
jgi:hypothetical protein